MPSCGGPSKSRRRRAANEPSLFPLRGRSTMTLNISSRITDPQKAKAPGKKISAEGFGALGQANARFAGPAAWESARHVDVEIEIFTVSSIERRAEYSRPLRSQARIDQVTFHAIGHHVVRQLPVRSRQISDRG